MALPAPQRTNPERRLSVCELSDEMLVAVGRNASHALLQLSLELLTHQPPTPPPPPPNPCTYQHRHTQAIDYTLHCTHNPRSPANRPASALGLHFVALQRLGELAATHHAPYLAPRSQPSRSIDGELATEDEHKRSGEIARRSCLLYRPLRVAVSRCRVSLPCRDRRNSDHS